MTNLICTYWSRNRQKCAYFIANMYHYRQSQIVFRTTTYHLVGAHSPNVYWEFPFKKMRTLFSTTISFWFKFKRNIFIIYRRMILYWKPSGICSPLSHFSLPINQIAQLVLSLDIFCAHPHVFTHATKGLANGNAKMIKKQQNKAGATCATLFSE